jgi:hypothetical protein
MSRRESQPQALRHAIGARLKALRGAEHAEVIAAVARSRWGLPWTRSVVTQIENGRRRLWLEEWLLLPALYTEALGRKHKPVSWQELLGDEEARPIALTRGLIVHMKDLHQLVEQAGKLTEEQLAALSRPHVDVSKRLNAAEKRARRWWKDDIPMHVVQAVFAGASDEANVRAARALGVDPFDVGFASFYLWEKPFPAERDERTAREAKPGESPAALRTRRGHKTTLLLGRLRTLLEGK